MVTIDIVSKTTGETYYSVCADHMSASGKYFFGYDENDKKEFEIVVDSMNYWYRIH